MDEMKPRDRTRVQPRISTSTLKKVKLLAVEHELSLEGSIEWILETGLLWIQRNPKERPQS